MIKLMGINVKNPVERFVLGDAVAETYTDEEAAKAVFGGRLYMPRQTHTANIAIVDRGVREYSETDALISLDPDIAVAVRTADCIPVLLYAPDKQMIAAVHAGWRGTVGKIALKTVDRMRELGANPKQMYAAIMPGICGDCYEVSHEVYAQFYPDHKPVGPNPHLDLKEINRQQLLQAGLKPENIRMSHLCTLHSDPSLHSYRRNSTPLRNLNVIHLK